MVIDVGGVDDLDGQAAMAVAIQFLRRRGFIADQQDADAQFARGQNGAFDFGARRMVSAHSIESDGGHLYTDGPQENASSER